MKIPPSVKNAIAIYLFIMFLFICYINSLNYLKLLFNDKVTLFCVIHKINAINSMF